MLAKAQSKFAHETSTFDDIGRADPLQERERLVRELKSLGCGFPPDWA